MDLNGTFLSGPQLIAALHVHENLRKAERLQRVSGDLKERSRLQLLLGHRHQAPAVHCAPCPVPDRAA